MKKHNITIAILSSLFLSSCGSMMHSVMTSCEVHADFNDYASCIKGTYHTEGRRPNSATVKAFYARLNEIDEAYSYQQLTDAQARSLAHQAYMETVEAGNERIRSRAATINAANLSKMQTCTKTGNTVTCF